MSTLTSKGQITTPKPIRGARRRGHDRFDAVRGKADIRWRTDDLMKLLRGDD